MEDIMNDFGYQQSLESMIYHKMLVRDLIFKDPVYMAMTFCELLKNILKETSEAEVEFEGSTSILHVKGQFTFGDVNVAMCKALATSIESGTNDRGSFMQILTQELIATTGLDTCTCMNTLLEYLNNPAKLQSFFKIFNIAPNEYQICLN